MIAFMLFVFAIVFIVSGGIMISNGQKGGGGALIGVGVLFLFGAYFTANAPDASGGRRRR
jgi:hypothetical protein